jgi:hypothetical protein
MIGDYGSPYYQDNTLIGYQSSLFSVSTPKYFIDDFDPCIKIEIREISNNNRVDLSLNPTEIFYDS